MLTPKEVSEKTFPRVSLGGYQMSGVDEFLDALTEDYSALYKENATLKAKLKVLAEKVEEYRATEDGMRATLLTAQRMAAQLVQEAQTEKEQVLQKAREEVATQISLLDGERAEAERKLDLAKTELAQFVQRSRELCAAQTAFLEQLPEMKLEAVQPVPQVSTDDTVRLIGRDIVRGFAQAEEEPAAAQEAFAPAEPEVPVEEIPISEMFAASLDELKFGRNYDGEV